MRRPRTLAEPVAHSCRIDRQRVEGLRQPTLRLFGLRRGSQVLDQAPLSLPVFCLPLFLSPIFLSALSPYPPARASESGRTDVRPPLRVARCRRTVPSWTTTRALNVPSPGIASSDSVITGVLLGPLHFQRQRQSDVLVGIANPCLEQPEVARGQFGDVLNCVFLGRLFSQWLADDREAADQLRAG